MDITNDLIDQKTIDDIVRAVSSIKFGYVQIIVHDSQVAQIDKTERMRLNHQKIKKGGANP